MSQADAILFGETAKPNASRASAKSYDPREAALRTAIAEESDPDAREWVLGVIANRAKKSGKNFYEVVTEEGQFEPWARGTAQKVDVNSDEYKKLSERAQDILDGKRDPSGGATHFYAPEAQAELAKKDGRSPKAEFDDGTGIRVGKTLFFRKGDGTVQAVNADDVLFGDGPPEKVELTAQKPTISAKDGKVTFGDTGAPVSPHQQEVIATLAKANKFDETQPQGSLAFPWVQRNAQDTFGPGEYYIPVAPEKGAPPIARMPGGDDKGSDLLRGLARGGGDVALSIAEMLPGSEEGTIPSYLKANQMLYDADLKGDFASGAARLTGQVVGSIPLLAGGELAAAKAAGSSPFGRFLIGEAGKKMAPGLAKFVTRAGSIGAKGAAGGAGGGALVSSATDESLAQDMALGAAGGGVIAPLGAAAGKAGVQAGKVVRGLVEPLTESGREKIVGRLMADVGDTGVRDVTELVPGSYPTAAEAAGNAGVSTLERQARTDPRMVSVFNERMAQNAEARNAFFKGIAKDGDAITEAESAREAATSKLREAAFKNAGAADPAPVIATVDEILKSPAGQRDVVVKALDKVREKLTADGGQTDVQQLYGIRKAIGDMLDPLGPQETKGAVLAKAELMAVKKSLDKAIEKAAPGFREYLNTYEEMSRPVDELKFLQSLKITDTKGNITLGGVQKALDRIAKDRKAKGPNDAKSLTAETIKGLEALRDDLKRAGNIDLGKARGSDSVQNLATQALAAEANVPMALNLIPKLGPALAVGKLVYGDKNAKTLSTLTSRLLNPESAVPVPKAPADPSILQRVLPLLYSGAQGAAGAGLSRFVGQ